MAGPADDERRALREAVAALMDKYSTEARVRELMATDTGHDDVVWGELAGMGLLGLAIPDQYGGSAAGYAERTIVAEEMGRALFVGPYLSTAVLTPALLTALGDTSECDRVLPAIADGSMCAALAFAEDGAAGIPDSAATTATAAGGTWQVTGEKTYVLDAAIADTLYVLATTDDGPSVFAVARNTAGVQHLPLTTVDLTRKMYRVQLRDAPARIIGEPGSGIAALAAALRAGGIAILGDQAGGAQRVMALTSEYARTRYQFARAIGSFQAVKHMCADMLVESESATSAARHVAMAFDTGAVDADIDLALAQAYCADAYVTVAATAIQVHGGIGFTWEHPAHLYLRRARTDAQLFGDAAAHRERYLAMKGV